MGVTNNERVPAGTADRRRWGVCSACKQEGDIAPNSRCRECEAKRAAEYRLRKPDVGKRNLQKWLDKLTPEQRANREHAKHLTRYAHIKAGDVTRQQLMEIYEKAGGRCHYCATEVQCKFRPSTIKGFDHIVALCLGGRHTQSNLVVCCKSCNAEKAKAELRAINRKHWEVGDGSDNVN